MWKVIKGLYSAGRILEVPMAAPFVIEPKIDEAIDNGIIHMNMLVEPGQAEGFAIFVSHFPPLGGGPPAHHHNTYDEAFYVLSGEMEFRVDGETARVPAGSMAWVPRGAIHAFRNPRPEPADMLVVTSPDAIDLITRVPEGLRSPEAMQALFAEHNSQLHGPPLG
jgi:mannose-6-phosphate isomerase-like protein (cupin superfamily)